MTAYFRPLVQTGRARPEGAFKLAGGPCWFTHVERLTRDRVAEILVASEMPEEVLDKLTATRPPLAGLAMDRMQLMGILNVTPDSFSDGGAHSELHKAIAVARAMVAAGADLLDIGGESTRPGADFVPENDEIARIAPVVKALADLPDMVPLSIDTRKAGVARAAAGLGAELLNDVSALTFDAAYSQVAAETGLPVCLMHAQGDPATMQADPTYDNVLLDVFDYLQDRLTAAEEAGLSRDNLVVDPGIGFGKTLDHNLILLRNISLFHALGVPVLLGVSRKRFIGTLGECPEAKDRAPGSIAVGLAAMANGVQILRVHDVAETRQAMRLFEAVNELSSEHGA